MVLHKTYISKEKSVHAGFTLIEVLVVLALLGTVLGATLFFTTSTYQRTAFLSERDSLISVLQNARGKALNNVNQRKHGVAIFPVSYTGYVLFEGDTFLSSDISSRTYTPSAYHITFDDLKPAEIIFDQLSGNASYDGQITLIDGNRLATTSIFVNYEGAIGK